MKKKTKMATTSTAKASNKIKKLTLNEFRAWLAGVEEMQSDDWTPDPTQWSRIRSKIEDIQDNPRSFNSGGTGPSDDYEQPARVLRAQGPSSLLVAPGAVVPGPMPNTPPPFMNTSDLKDGARIKTPNVDTSAREYTSSLE